MHVQGRHGGLPRAGASRRCGLGRPVTGRAALTFPAAPAVLALAVGLLATAALASCSSGPGSAGGPASRTIAPAVILKAAPLPHKVANDPSVRKDVSQTTCAAIPGGWSAGGTAKNSGAHAATYKITVYFTTEQATTLDYAVATVHVPAGQSSAWVAQKRFKAQKQMLCPMPGIAKVG